MQSKIAFAIGVIFASAGIFLFINPIKAGILWGPGLFCIGGMLMYRARQKML